MIIHSKGYDLVFVQKQRSRDESDHEFTYIYKFKSELNRWKYIIRAEYHKGGVFAVKFYAQQQRKSEFKYSNITNKGDVYNILVTTAKLIPILLIEFPDASFGFTGARSVDKRSLKVESYENNQRFRVYRGIVSSLIGTQTFTHFEYVGISSYLLINNRNNDVKRTERDLVKMFQRNYIDLPDIG